MKQRAILGLQYEGVYQKEMFMGKITVIISICFLSMKVFAGNVIPQCKDISSMGNAIINNTYNNSGEIFYTFGLAHKFFGLNMGECITSQEPGVYITTLTLNSDGNLVNYLYNVQDDITYITFSSDTMNQGINQAAFYLDSNSTVNLKLELLSTDYSAIKTIIPLSAKDYDKQLSGSLVLSNISNQQNATPNGLSTYDAANGSLFTYAYNYHPVEYLDLFFDNHTLETRDAEYNVTILDYTNSKNTPQTFSCSLPFTESSCNEKLKYVQPNHYVVYLNDNVKIEIAKLYKNNKNLRAMYINGRNYLYFGWNENSLYNIYLQSNNSQSVPLTYEWTPTIEKYYSSLHLLSWDDKPSVPAGTYQATCNMSGMEFNSGILTGSCSYVDSNGMIHWTTSSLNYDKLCKSDLTENDLVVNNQGQLSCQSPT